MKLHHHGFRVGTPHVAETRGRGRAPRRELTSIERRPFMTEASRVLSDRFAFRLLGAVASLDDFGRYADSALALTRSTFGHAETEETVRHMVGDYVVLTTDTRNDTVAGLTVLSPCPATPEAPGQQHTAHVKAISQAGALPRNGRRRCWWATGSIPRELNRLRFEQILDRTIQTVTTTTQNPKVDAAYVQSLTNSSLAIES